MPRVEKNESSMQLSGNHLRWKAITPEGTTYCETRECARAVIRSWRKEREELKREFLRIQGHINFYE